MTGIEIIGVIVVIGALTGMITGASTDMATKTEACILCVKTETSSERDVDVVTIPNLGDEVILRPAPEKRDQ